MMVVASKLPSSRVALLNKTSLDVVRPTRILNSDKLHMDKAPAPSPEDAHSVFHYETKQELKRKYTEWMYNAVLQQ